MTKNPPIDSRDKAVSDIKILFLLPNRIIDNKKLKREIIKLFMTEISYPIIADNKRIHPKPYMNSANI